MELVKEFGEVVGESEGQGHRKVLGKEWVIKSITTGQRVNEGPYTVRASYGTPPPRKPGSTTPWAQSNGTVPSSSTSGSIAARIHASLEDEVGNPIEDDLRISWESNDTIHESLTDPVFPSQVLQDVSKNSQVGASSADLTGDNVPGISSKDRSSNGRRSISSSFPPFDRKSYAETNKQDRRTVSMRSATATPLITAPLLSETGHRTLKKPRISTETDHNQVVIVDKLGLGTEPGGSPGKNDLADFDGFEVHPSFIIPADKVRTPVQTQRKPTPVELHASHRSSNSGKGRNKILPEADKLKRLVDRPEVADPTKIFQDRLGRPISFCILGSGPVQKRLELLIPAFVGGVLSGAATASVLVVTVPTGVEVVRLIPAWKETVLSAIKAPHRFVVAHTWVDRCIDQIKWVDHEPYLLELQGDTLILGGIKGINPDTLPAIATYQREASAVSSSSASTWNMPQTPDTVSTFQEYFMRDKEAVKGEAETLTGSESAPRKRSIPKRARKESAEFPLSEVGQEVPSVNVKQEVFGYTSQQSEYRPTTRSALAGVGAGKTDVYLEKGEAIQPRNQIEKIGWQPKTRPDKDDQEAYANLIAGLNAWAGTEPGAKKLSMSRTAFLHGLDRKCPAHKSYESLYKKYEYMLRGDVPNFALINGRRKRYWAMVPMDDEDRSE